MEHKDLALAYTAAWNTGRPEAVAVFFVPDGTITINQGEPWHGREGIAQMAAGFFADVPDLCLTCDGLRAAGDHVAYLWTFKGTHAGTGNPLTVTGWEEWDLVGEGRIRRSLGWFDADDYARQAAA